MDWGMGRPPRPAPSRWRIRRSASRLINVHALTFTVDLGRTFARHKGMRLINLPAVASAPSRPSATRACRSPTRWPDLTPRSSSTPPTRPTSAAQGGPDPHRSPHGRAGVEAGEVGRRRRAVLQARRGEGGSLGPSPHRGRTGHRRLPQAAYGRDSHFIPYGAPDPGPGLGQARRARARAREYHLVVARMEPENHVALIVEGYLRASDHPAGRRGFRAVRRRVHGARPSARRATATSAPRRRVGPGPAQPALRQQPQLPPRALRRRDQPIAAPGPGVRRARDRLRRELQSRGHGRARPVLQTTPICVRGDHRRREGPRAAVARGATGQVARRRGLRWEDVTDGYEACLLELAQSRTMTHSRRYLDRGNSAVDSRVMDSRDGAQCDHAHSATSPQRRAPSRRVPRVRAQRGDRAPGPSRGSVLVRHRCSAVIDMTSIAGDEHCGCPAACHH